MRKRARALICGLAWACVVQATAAGLAANPDAALKMTAVLERLEPLPTRLQLDRLDELSADSAEARVLAAVVRDPGLIERYRGPLESWIGTALIVRAGELSASMRRQAKVDNQVRSRLEPSFAYAHRGLKELRALSAQLAESREAAEPGALSAALIWSLDGEPAHEQQVHQISRAKDRWLVNGKAAETLSRQDDGVVLSELVVHPEDPETLVKIYHSPASLEAFRRKNEKLADLAALSSAQAAPRLLEHGEASVAGQGRVYFYAQRRARGRALSEIGAAERPLDAVADLFSKLAAAGLRLVVPASGQDWLLSHLMIDQAPSAGMRAYLLGGSVQREAPERLSAHYGMLRALLKPEKREAPVESLPAIPAAVQPVAPTPEISAKPDSGENNPYVQWAREMSDPNVSDDKAHGAAMRLNDGLTRNLNPGLVSADLERELFTTVWKHVCYLLSLGWSAPHSLNQTSPAASKIIVDARGAHPTRRVQEVFQRYQLLVICRKDLVSPQIVLALKMVLGRFFRNEKGALMQPESRDLLRGAAQDLAWVAQLVFQSRPDFLSLGDLAEIVTALDARVAELPHRGVDRGVYSSLRIKFSKMLVEKSQSSAPALVLDLKTDPALVAQSLIERAFRSDLADFTLEDLLRAFLAVHSYDPDNKGVRRLVSWTKTASGDPYWRTAKTPANAAAIYRQAFVARALSGDIVRARDLLATREFGRWKPRGGPQRSLFQELGLNSDLASRPAVPDDP